MPRGRIPGHAAGRTPTGPSNTEGMRKRPMLTIVIKGGGGLLIVSGSTPSEPATLSHCRTVMLMAAYQCVETQTQATGDTPVSHQSTESNTICMPHHFAVASSATRADCPLCLCMRGTMSTYEHALLVAASPIAATDDDASLCCLATRDNSTPAN